MVMSKSQAALKDGDTFQAQTVEGINMTFKVLSEAEKTCEVAPYAAIDNQTAGSVTIPSEANGYTVTSIGYGAFSGYSGLTSITIPNSVTSIGNDAFGECSGLTSMTIPSSVTSIGDYAFVNCSGLTSIAIPNSVTTIGYGVFVGCGNLTYIIIPNSVTNIENDVFAFCVSLIHIEIPNSVVIIGGSAFLGCSGLTSIKIPNSVTSIGSNAFNECSGLTSITIPNSVTSIGDDAFYGCRELDFVMIPNSVTSIGKNPFAYCSDLTSIIVDSNNTVYDSRDNCNAIIRKVDNTLISGCKNTIIPYSVTSIGNWAFYSCSSLITVTIPNSVSSIGGWAFFDCKDLTTITIANSVTSIGDYAFSGCDQLTDVYCYATLVPSTGNNTFSQYNATLHVPASSLDNYKNTDPWSNFITIVPIEEEPTELNLNDGDIFEAQTVEGINMKFRVLSAAQKTCEVYYNAIGGQASGSVTIPSEVNGYMVIAIGNRAFPKIDALSSVTIPNTVTTIGDHAFYSCSGLTSIIIPNSVTTIGGSAFSSCNGLTSITIPNSVTTIGDDAFWYCSGLTSIIVDERNTVYDSRNNCNAIIRKENNTLISGCKNTIIPNNVTTIRRGSFAGCSGLTSVTIPSSVTSIEDYAFWNCSKLTDVYCYAIQVPSLGNKSFSQYNATLHVPASALNSYKTTVPWSNFATIVPIEEEPTEFAYDGNLWHVGGSYVANDFKSINDAMQSDRVKNGDILFIEEGSSISGMQYVTKSVKVMGPGFSVKAGEKKPPYHLQNGLSIEAPHVTIDGLGINGNVTICDNYATVQHCCVRNILAGEDFECTDAMINANFIGGYINAEGGEDWTVSNNVVYTVGNTYSIYGEGLTLNHNNIYNLSATKAVDVSASSITNNVIINKSGKALESHDAFANERNILSDDPNNNFPNNTYGILSLEDVFNHRAELVYQNMYWYVLLNSIAYQYGNDGKDCGAYGYKVRPSELPIFNPITVPETTTDEKKLTISVYAMRDDWLGKGIDALEYFWDFDPGWGQATPIIGGTPVKDYGIDVRNFVIDCSNLAVGRHTLVVRARSGQLWAVSIHQVAVVEQVSGSTNHYVLNKTATEAPSQYLYNSLESLFNAMAHNGLAEQTTVDVVDNTYEMEIPTMSSWHSATTSGIDAELSALESDINYMNEYVGVKESTMQQLAQSGKQLTMTALQYATFNFKITTAADYQTLRNKIDAVSKSIPTLSTSPEEHAQYTAHLMAIETRLNSFVEQWKSSLQTLISKVTTENISIIIDGATYRYGIEDMIDPNDLLALRVISQYLNVGNYWNFANNGREQDDFPGVTFIDHRVTGIDLSGRGLEGELNYDWNPQLPELTYLNLSNNAITGNLTPFVQDMPKLKTLTMNNNRLTAISGKLPASLSSFNVRSQWRQSNTGSGANQAICSWIGELTPTVAYLSPSTDFELPTLFTYNPNSNNNSLHPDLQVVNPQSPTTIYGTYTYNATAGKYKFQPRQDNDYTLPQDAEVALTIATQNTAQWWSAYPAMLRFVVGDANMDGMVSVLDVQQTLNYILATVQPFNYTAANTYSDQTINVQDIVCTVNILLGLPNTARTMKARQSATLPDETVEGWIYEHNERMVIAPQTDVAALDIELEGVSTDEVSLLLNRQQFQMIGRNTENGSRYIIFSPTGHVIPQDKVTALLALSRSALPIAVTAAGGNACEVLLGLSQPTGISDVMSQDSRRTVTETWLAPGIYIISTIAEDGTRTTVKVLKKTK